LRFFNGSGILTQNKISLDNLITTKWNVPDVPLLNSSLNILSTVDIPSERAQRQSVLAWRFVHTKLNANLTFKTGIRFC
jgi:hypothetical protein